MVKFCLTLQRQFSWNLFSFRQTNLTRELESIIYDSTLRIPCGGSALSNIPLSAECIRRFDRINGHTDTDSVNQIRSERVCEFMAPSVVNSSIKLHIALADVRFQLRLKRLQQRAENILDLPQSVTC